MRSAPRSSTAAPPRAMATGDHFRLWHLPVADVTSHTRLSAGALTPTALDTWCRQTLTSPLTTPRRATADMFAPSLKLSATIRAFSVVHRVYRSSTSTSEIDLAQQIITYSCRSASLSTKSWCSGFPSR
jgi:hypothetical protein